MEKLYRFAVAMAVFVWVSIGYAFAGEIDILVQKLVDKGVLSAGEAQQIVTETKEEVKKEIAQGKSSDSPVWAQRIKFKGDVRVRAQDQITKGSSSYSWNGRSHHRERERIRMRLGAEAKVNDQTKAYVGIATGSDAEPRSTNQTFQDSFAKKPVWLDYAYVDYMPVRWATLMAGRMKNPIWEPGDMLWDTDINPEGAGLILGDTFSPQFDWFINSAWFRIDEEAKGSDIWMATVQPGLNWKISEAIKSKIAVAYYHFKHLKDGRPDWSANSNNRTNLTGTNTGLEFGFNAISPSAQISFTDPFKPLNISLLDAIPYLSFFGEYHHNLDAKYADNGWLGGVVLGNEKIEDWKNWQIKYQYVLLETQAWPDIFPDSDRYSGATGIRSNEVIFAFGLGKNWQLNLDYYCTDRTQPRYEVATDPDSGSDSLEHLIQADLVWKF